MTFNSPPQLYRCFEANMTAYEMITFGPLTRSPNSCEIRVLKAFANS